MSKISSAPAWLGLNEDKTDFIVLPEKFDIVRRLFEETARGVGAYVLAKRLNEEGVPTIGPSPVWVPSSITKILYNPAVTGTFIPKSKRGGKITIGDPVPDYYPRVISDELFEEVVRARKSNRDSNRGRKGAQFTNLFTGMLFCHCGSRMKFDTQPKQRSFLCARFVKTSECTSWRWDYTEFESTMLDALRSDAITAKALGTALRDVGDETGGSDIYLKRSTLNLELKKIVYKIVINSSENPSDGSRASIQLLSGMIRNFDLPPDTCVSLKSN
jgi:hypothetical protein